MKDINIKIHLFIVNINACVYLILNLSYFIVFQINFIGV